MLLVKSTPVQRTRGLLFALLAALTLSIASPVAESRAAPLVPPSTIAMRATKSCNWQYTWFAGTSILQVYTGEVVQFGVIDSTGATAADIYSWSFPGATPSTAQSALGSKTLIRRWNTPGTYVVTAVLGGSQFDQTLTVIVTADPMVSIEGTFTCDNFYRFFVGTEASVTTAFGAVDNALPGDIENAETFSVNAPLHGYVYVAAWSDKSNNQGLLGELRRRGAWAFIKGKAAPTGHPDWQVIDTGIPKYDYTSPGGPSNGLMNSRINNANDKSLWTSGGGLSCGVFPPPGYVDFGQSNFLNTSPTLCNNFPEVEQITARANWIWFNDLSSSCSFLTDPAKNNILIFRFPVDSIPEPPLPPIPVPNLDGVAFGL